MSPKREACARRAPVRERFGAAGRARSVPPPSTDCVRLQIELQPETATQRWHAVVRDGDGRFAFEAGTPLELVRRLAQWSLPRAHGVR